MYIPLQYDKINLIEGTYQPSPIKNRNNASFDFWVRSLFHRAGSTLIFGVPDYWQGRILEFWYYVLFKYGYLSVQDLTDLDEDGEKIGMCFNPVGLTGYNFYYQYTKALLSNPVLKDTKELVIGKDCELVTLTPDLMGIWDVLEFYADKLSNLDNAINMSIINNKFAWILGGKTKAATQTLKKLVDKINSGQPAVFYDARIMNDPKDKDTPFQFMQRENLKQSYLTTDQLQDLHTILNDFDAEIGIPTVPYQKKERETAFESQAKQYDGRARSLVWYRCLDSSIKIVNKLYPDLNLSVKLRWGEEYELSENDPSGPRSLSSISE